MKSKIFILSCWLLSALTCLAQTWQVQEDYDSGVGGTIEKVSSAGMDFTFLASPSEGYKFLFWIDGNTDNPRTFSASQTEDVLIRAVFAKVTDVEPTNGSVDIQVLSTTTPSYTLTAQPEDCSLFLQWSNGSTATSLTYTEDMGTCAPSFSAGAPDQIFVNYTQGSGGSIVGEPVANTCREYSFTAVPESGYEFLYWSDGITSAHRNFNYIGGDVLLRAVFGRTEDIHQNYGNTEALLVDNVTPSYQLTAVPGSCATFNKWNNNATDVTIEYEESDGTRVPSYNAQELLHRNNDGVGGTITLTPIMCGFILTPVPETGYQFAYWEDGSTTTPREVDFIEGDYTATFVSSDIVALRGENTYTNLQDAIDADGSDPVQILFDVPSQDVVVSSQLTINGAGHTIGNLTILCGGDLTLGDELVVNNVYLNTTTGSSSQLHNANNLSYSEAYLDVRLESTLANASPNKWYAFAVPFAVDVNTGVARQSGSGSPLTNTEDYLIWEYDGQMRADNQENGWKKLLAGTLTPGKFYMIGIDGNENTWRFKKASGPLGGESSLSVSEFSSADYRHGGWNALANSLLTYANASCSGITYAQIYDNASASGKYDVVALNEMSFVVASPFFIQAGEDGSLTLSEGSSGVLHAPQRQSSSALSYKVTLSNATQQDHLYLTASEESVDEYQIGKDVLKLLGGNKDSYIWAYAYGNRLCAQDARWDGVLVSYEIGMFAASHGAYTISAEGNADATIYLMENGMAIANLSVAPYQLTLKQGNNPGYSIMVYRPSQTPTDLNPIDHPQNGVYKTIENTQLKIHVNDRIYNAQGGLLH